MNAGTWNGELLSRSEIATRAGVERPAVTNWQRRHPDYPEPVRVGDEELFHAGEIHTWLSRRVVPRNGLRPGETHGTTYGDRFATVLGRAPIDPGKVRRVVDELLGKAGASLLGSGWNPDHQALLQELLLLRTRPTEWQDIALEFPPAVSTVARKIAEAGGDPHRHPLLRDQSSGIALGEAIRIIDRLSPPQEVAAAYDALLDAAATRQGPRAADILTPPSVRAAMLAVLSQGARPGSLYDPYCRSGELLVDAAPMLAPGATVRGTTMRADNARSSSLNLAVHSVRATVDLRPGFPEPAAPGRYDLVLANPPFSMKAPASTYVTDRRWPFGPPPAHNLDLAWIQHVVLSLADGGRGAVVMPHGAAFRSGRERDIRAALVESGAIECLVSLPGGLFAATSIPVMIWILRPPHRAERRGVLMIDATELGTRTPRGRRLAAPAVTAIAAAYLAWHTDGALSEISACPTTDELRSADYQLVPARYLDPSPRQPSAEVDEIRQRLSDLEHRAALADRRLTEALKGWMR
ncbi:N-6 DNA methylase [Kitasatospora sp. NPDC051984]|uniref:N-6 DNA methylase n=1 Tax=Kitasatospora sp. NPDC051984 TaxID=3364059 RepID=UPI0037C5C2AB